MFLRPSAEVKQAGRGDPVGRTDRQEKVARHGEDVAEYTINCSSEDNICKL